MQQPKKILLAHLFSNGDCLFATTVARQIKQDFPHSHLTWAVAGFCAGIIEQNPYVDDILIEDSVPKSDASAFRRYERRLKAEKEAGVWDEVFNTTNLGNNLALYDGTVRGMILRAYPFKITVPFQSVLSLTDREVQRAKTFAEKYQLSSYGKVILWEYQPQSGQAVMDKHATIALATQIANESDVCFIMSSAHGFPSARGVLDGSELSLRETVAVSHYCDYLIGCSSGISWATMSSAGKKLPMLQFVNPKALFLNLLSRDFRRYGIEHAGLTEIDLRRSDKMLRAVRLLASEGFDAVSGMHEEFAEQFLTTKTIIYNLMVYREFTAVRDHIRIMRAQTENPAGLKRAVLEAITAFPWKLVRNLLKSRK